MQNSAFRISPTQPFIPCLAEGIFARYSAAELAQAELFLPSFHSVEEFRKYWFEKKYQPLSKVVLLASADEEFYPEHENNAQEILSRSDMRLLVHRLFYEAGNADSGLISALYSLLVLLERQEISFKEIVGKLPNISGVSQATLPLLQEILRKWRAELANLRTISWVEDEQQKLRNLLTKFQESNTKNPIIIAGSTGSIASVLRLMRGVLGLVNGSVVFSAPEIPEDVDYYNAIDVLHPLFGIKKFFAETKPELKLWHGELTEQQKQKELLWLQLSIPADLSDRWIENKIIKSACEKPLVVQCDTISQEEALIEKILIDAKEQQKKKLAVISPDVNLRKRLAQYLSARAVVNRQYSGKNLREYASIQLIERILEYIAKPCASSLVAILNHPWCSAGYDEQLVRNARSWLEVRFLRKKNAFLGAEFLLEQVNTKATTEAEKIYGEWLAKIFQIIETEFADVESRNISFLEWLESLERAASSLSINVENTAQLWSEGEEIKNYWQNFLRRANWFALMSIAEMRSFLAAIWSTISLAAADKNIDENIAVWILSPVEARLLSFDLVILAHMNEGSWPVVAENGPWINRHGFLALGLDSPDRVVGQSWSDALFFIAGTECILTRSIKENGENKRASRIVQRLKILQTIAAVEKNDSVILYQNYLSEKWQPKRLSEKKAEISVSYSKRPEDLSATSLAQLLADPYGYYARYILRLRKLEDLDANLDGRDFGIILHKILEEIASKISDFSSAQKMKNLAYEILLREAKFIVSKPYWWWPRIERIVDWYSKYMRDNAEKIQDLLVEHKFEGQIFCGDLVYKISARADRLEYFSNEKGRKLIDFKTGDAPSSGDVARGVAPQLAIIAWLIEQQKEKLLPAGELWRAEFWELKGSYPVGDIKKIEAALDFQNTEAGIRSLLEYFSRDDAIYRAVPNPNIAPKYNDYEHLERI